MIGDGTGLPITHTGSVSLPSSRKSFKLDEVLCVPSIKKNLISVSQLCTSNKVSVEFFPQNFQVKDLCTKDVLHQGSIKDGVYEWPQNQHSSSPLLAFSTSKTSTSSWHQRLGHPSFSVLQHIIHSNELESSALIDVSCNACSCNKSYKLLFTQSTLSSSYPLDIIFSDVWSSPVLSINNFKYYVVFVDHRTR